MGKVILVPPPVRLNLPKPRNGSNVWGGENQVYPVSFHNYGSGQQAPNGQYGTDGFGGSVIIPEPMNDYVYIDPLMSFGSYYDFGGTNLGSPVSNRTRHASPLIHRLTIEQVVKRFWDHTDVEREVDAFVGDVLLQIDDQSGNNGWGRSWNFLITNSLDADALKTLIDGHKSHRFEIHKGFRVECAAWLRENATDYDFFEGSSRPYHDTYYVRDDTEAVHFKMKWYGIEPEVEEEEEVFF